MTKEEREQKVIDKNNFRIKQRDSLLKSGTPVTMAERRAKFSADKKFGSDYSLMNPEKRNSIDKTQAVFETEKGTPEGDKAREEARAMIKEQEESEANNFINEADRFYRENKADGGLPDLTGDGKVTQADVLKGRGVFNKGSLMSDPVDREKYNKGKLVKNATKALFNLFREDVSEKQIKSKMEAVHNAVEKAPTGPKKADTLKQVAIDQDLTLKNVKDIEKLYAYKSGGGGKENIFGEVKQVLRAMTTKGTSGQLDAEDFGGARTTREARKKAGEAFIGGSLLTGASIAGVTTAWNALNTSPPTPSEASEFEKAFSAAHNAGKNTFMFKNKEYTTNVRKGKVKGGELGDDDYDYEEHRRIFLEEMIQARKEQDEAEKERREKNKLRTAETLKEKMTAGEKRAIEEETKRLNDEAAKNFEEDKNRLGFNEGSLMMPLEGMPVDTYDNIPPEEMEEAMASQLPDDEMEDDYTSYVMDESLDDNEQEYLASVLQSDPRLSDILDKVITVASEFSGAGEVDGPGTGVSDSIPARLSDGEFVMTKKATDQIGADNLQVMMDDAERAYDGGYQMKAMGGMMEEENPEDPSMSKTDEEIKKLMMGANRMPSLQ